MSRLINAAWPYTRDTIFYHQGIPAGHGVIKVLQVYAEKNGGLQLDFVEQKAEELMHRLEPTRRYYLRLAIIMRSWKIMGTSHTRVVQLNISQEDFSSILIQQKLASFYHQTRVNIAGVFTPSLTYEDHKDHQDEDSLAIIYDSYLGLWAKYGGKLGHWQGVYIIPEMSLNIICVAEELINFAQSRTFLYFLVAKFGMDYSELDLEN